MSQLAERNAEHVSTIAKLEAQLGALAAESAALKSKGRELLNEACGVYEKYNASINPENGDFMDGQTLHEFQFLLNVETPVTDSFLREVRAQGVDMLHAVFNQAGCVGSPALHSAMNTFMLNIASKIRNGEFSVELRKGGAA